MHTMDVFVVTGWEMGENDRIEGIYQSKDHAEYIRDHLEAKSYDRRFNLWNRLSDSQKKYYAPPSFESWVSGYRVEEEEVYLA